MEFGAYWMHRWHHSHPCLWSLHALHHGPDKLHALNNFRVHPLNYALQFALSTLPLLLLGVPQNVLLAWLAVSQPVLMLQHLNVDLKSGWLNAVFSTNELHRWHHSNSPATGNVNFGSTLTVWDHVFGTYRPVDASGDPGSVGLFATSRYYPAQGSYWSQLGVLCGKRCCSA
jgi:sterol desaturase/sphingolipid hydroxylase (fatty acid hydroxylase superfamily)